MQNTAIWRNTGRDRNIDYRHHSWECITLTVEHNSNITKAGGHFCDSCGEPINPVRKWHRFCSHKCQVRKWRKVKTWKLGGRNT
jgi:hypothetical protein